MFGSAVPQEPYQFSGAIFLPYDEGLTALEDLSFRIVFAPGKTPRFFGPSFVPGVQSFAVGYDDTFAQSNGYFPDGPRQEVSGVLRVRFDEAGELSSFVYQGTGGFSMRNGRVRLPGGRTYYSPIAQDLFFPPDIDRGTVSEIYRFDEPAPVPLPATAPALALALSVLGFAARRRRC